MMGFGKQFWLSRQKIYMMLFCKNITIFFSGFLAFFFLPNLCFKLILPTSFFMQGTSFLNVSSCMGIGIVGTDYLCVCHKQRHKTGNWLFSLFSSLLFSLLVSLTFHAYKPQTTYHITPAHTHTHTFFFPDDD